MTVKSKKRRLQRAHAHQALAKGRDQFHNAFTHSMPMIEKENLALTPPPRPERQPDPQLVTTIEASQIPTRTKCPTCGFSQKVRKDGTMSRHDIFVGSDAQQCEGTGKLYDGG